MPIFMREMLTPYCKEIVTEVRNLSSQSNIITWSSKSQEKGVLEDHKDSKINFSTPQMFKVPLRAQSGSLTLKKIFPLVETHEGTATSTPFHNQNFLYNFRLCDATFQMHETLHLSYLEFSYLSIIDKTTLHGGWKVQ